MKVLVPATSANLGPGFDCLGLGLGLYNEVEIKRQNFHSISIKGENENSAKFLKNNYFVMLFNEIYQKLTGEIHSFKFNFVNNIPFSRGLGSSSAVIVSAIASAYKLAGFEVKKQTILNEALIYENHPDNITPATYGGFTSSVIFKNSVIVNKAEISDEIKAVVVIPDIKMPTQKARKQLPKNLPLQSCVANLSGASFIASCFFSKNYKDLRYGAIDKIHENIRMKNLPELFEIRDIAYANGSLLSTLSGSGSSFLNITYKDDAKSLKDKLLAKFPKFRVEILNFDNDGFRFS